VSSGEGMSDLSTTIKIRGSNSYIWNKLKSYRKMNTLTQLNRSIEKIENRIEELESSYLISFTVKNAIELKDLKSDLRVLKLKRDRESQKQEKASQIDSLNPLRELFESFNPYNNN
jgi:hypothetical protein